MKYTLYIDESGDFETLKGNWVVAGILFNTDYATCEKILTEQLKHLPQIAELKSIKDFHLTEIRSKLKNSEKVMSLASNCFSQLNKLPLQHQFVATINHKKTSLEHSEKTYRLMLVDLISLCETALPSRSSMGSLDLVIATRTKDKKRLTTFSDINNEVINALPGALEASLATRGLIDLIGNKLNIHMDYANNTWGLVFADFMANINYHYKKKTESEFLNSLALNNKYFLFESLGGIEHRRAAISEREKDYPLAIYKWLQISIKIKESTKAQEHIYRILKKLYQESKTSGFATGFEVLLEKIWRTKTRVDSYKNVLLQLLNLEKILLEFISNEKIIESNVLLFRLRNLMLLTSNHLGDSALSNRVTDNQNVSLPTLISNPDNFKIILDFKVFEVEMYINDLQLEKAFQLANEYNQIINNYKEVWKLLLDSNDIFHFDESKANIKSVMTLMRVSIYCLGLTIDEIPPETESEFNKLADKLYNKQDQSRFFNCQIILFLKRNKPEKAIQMFTETPEMMRPENINPFDLLGLIRSYNDCLFKNSTYTNEIASTLIERSIAELHSATGHPYDLIFREFALLKFLTGEKSPALRYIRKAKTSSQPGRAPLNDWLIGVIELYEDFIKENQVTNKDYFKQLSNDPLVLALPDNTNLSQYIQSVRYLSLY